MSLTSALLRFARQVVQNVLSQLMQQFNVVETAAMQPMRAMVQLVQGGSIWRGEGANKFVQEVSSIFIPNVGRIGQQIQTVSGNLQRAVNVIDQADAQVNGLVSGLADRFGSIF